MSLRDDIARIVRAVLGDMTFERTYTANVELVSDDFVDVLPDDPKVRGIGLQRVPMPTIDPTTELVPAPGCRCLLAFAAGDPRKPYIAAWEYAQGSATVHLDGGAASVARKGDVIDVYLSPLTPIAGTMTATIQSPNPSPPPPTIPTTVPGGTPFAGLATIAAPVRAVIIGGAARVKA